MFPLFTKVISLEFYLKKIEVSSERYWSPKVSKISVVGPSFDFH